MRPPSLWVWIGSPRDTLDVLRYVRATEKDILRQPCVVAALEAVSTARSERWQKEYNEAIAAAHSAGRRAGLEEAAGEAEGRHDECHAETCEAREELEDLAATLRARAKKGRP
jgi:post-segregation antitoxin (ccd killing protein)